MNLSLAMKIDLKAPRTWYLLLTDSEAFTARPRGFFSLLSLLLLTCVGCQEDLRIRTYKVAKKKQSQFAIPPDSVAQSREQQMLGAIVPHSRSAWFFKLQGEPTIVHKNREEFRSIVDSVKFDNSGVPTWQLADGWKDQVLGGGITYAKLTKEQDGLTATVTMLAAMGMDNEQQWRKYVLDNINRWRGQLALEKEDSWEAVEENLEEVEELSEGPSRKAYFVSLIGKSSGGSFRPPFMTGSMPDSPKAQPAAEAEATPAAKPTLQYDVPDGWEEEDVSQTQMRRAAFSIADDDKSGEVKVIAAGGEASAMLPMWLNEVELESSDDVLSEIKSGAQELEVNGEQAVVYQVNGPSGESAQSITVAVVPWKEGESLYIKMQGDSELVESQQANFVAYLTSLKWE